MKKYQIYRSKTKNNKLFNFLYVFFIFNILSLIFFASSVSASPNYPIPELENCRDAQECKLYCEIPQNTPACWSYGKYVIKKNILGESSTSISYPVAELGNCTSANECFIFCNQPQNQKTCYDFAKSKGLIKEKPKLENIIQLAKKELGCQNDLECMVFCQQPDNMDACRAFAQKYNLVNKPSDKDRKPPSPEVLEIAKGKLGCSSESACMNFCNQPENRQKCLEFARENNLMNPEEAKDMEKRMQQRKEMMEEAKTELGCDSEESCKKLCTGEPNRDKCMKLGKKYGLSKEERNQKPPLPCTSETECKKYCESNPKECPGFGEKPNGLDDDEDKPDEKPQFNPDNKQKGNFLGPGGCKTEEECESYCEKHPDQCPGFPKLDSKPSPIEPREKTRDNFMQLRPPPPNQNQNFQNYSPDAQKEQNIEIKYPPRPEDN